jgi:hypothetical protein
MGKPMKPHLLDAMGEVSMAADCVCHFRLLLCSP